MKKNKNLVNLKKYSFAILVAAVFFATCAKIEKNNKIIDKDINTKKEIHIKEPIKKASTRNKSKQNKTYTVDANENSPMDFLQKNDSLYQNAYNKYSERIGKDFQLSNFFSQKEIDDLKSMLATNSYNNLTFLDSCSYARIMANQGSLNDLATFWEYLDYDFIQQNFKNKISPYYQKIDFSDSIDIDSLADMMWGESAYYEALQYDSKNTQNAFLKEFDLIENAWGARYVEKQIDTLNKQRDEHLQQFNNDSVQQKIIIDNYKQKQDTLVQKFITNNGELNAPNFSIPEFQNIKAEYVKNSQANNDLLKQYNYEDSVIHSKDSINKCLPTDSVNKYLPIDSMVQKQR